jgi:hypothetical protein
MGKKEESGSIVLDGEVVRYLAPDDSEVWSLPVSRVKVIGDMTNDHGPFGDDWFMCFATGLEGWLEFPIYAEGFQKFAGDLTALLGTNGWPALASSADYASNVIWPPVLAGKPMFKFTDRIPSHLLGRIWCKVFGPSGNTQTFSDEVEAFLKGTPQI